MKIKVLPHHIEGATPSAHGSPVAKAIKEATATDKEVAVWQGHVSFRAPDGSKTVYALPPEVDQAEARFKLTGKLDPFTFDLRRQQITHP